MDELPKQKAFDPSEVKPKNRSKFIPVKLHINTNGMFDSERNNEVLQEIVTNEEIFSDRYSSLEKRFETVLNDFDTLQNIANSATRKYEGRAKGNGKKHSTNKLFADILDHSLSSFDIELICKYIKFLFGYIVVSINRKLKDEESLNTIFDVHRRRKNNSVISYSYDEICSQLNITNSGCVNSDVYQLFSFWKDFRRGQNINYGDAIEECQSIDSTSDGEQETVQSISKHSQFSTNEVDLVGKHRFPCTSGYITSKINAHVLNRQLANSLKSCINAVHQIIDSDLV